MTTLLSDPVLSDLQVQKWILKLIEALSYVSVKAVVQSGLTQKFSFRRKTNEIGQLKRETSKWYL